MLSSLTRHVKWVILALLYLDNVAVLYDSWKGHIENFRAALGRLRDAKLTVGGSDKCEFGKVEVGYLVYMDRNTVVKADPHTANFRVSRQPNLLDKVERFAVYCLYPIVSPFAHTA